MILENVSGVGGAMRHSSGISFYEARRNSQTWLTYESLH